MTGGRGRGSKREHGAKKGVQEKGGRGREATGGRGAKSGSDASASDPENNFNFTRPPPPAVQVENYAVLNLDTPATSHDSWRATVLRFRLWCFINTKERYCFGHNQRQSCMMPETGHFLVYIHRRGKWICVVIDGPTGYLTGYITRSSTDDKKIQENRTNTGKGMSKEDVKELKSKLPIHIEGAAMLPWRGNYKYAAECLLGHPGLQNSFTLMYKHLEGIQKFQLHEVQQAGETFIINLPEAFRSNELYQKIDDNYIDGHCKLGSTLLTSSRNWSGRTRQALSRMINSSPGKWEVKEHGKSTGHEPKSVKEKEIGVDTQELLLIIEDIRLYFREKKISRIFRLQELPVQLGLHGPVDNKLSSLLKLGAQDLAHSRFLIEPFLKFTRASNTDQASNESKGNGNMEEKLGPSLDPEGCNDGPKSNMTNVEDKFRDSLDFSSPADEYKASAQVMSQQHKQAEQNPPDEYKVSSQVINHGGAALRNLGNTCFANSVLQFLHCIPHLKSALLRFSKEIGNKLVEVDQASCNLTDAICDVFVLLDGSLEVVSPEKFLEKLEEKYAMYKERAGKIHRQQDAGECLLHLMETLTETLRTEERESDNLIKRFFGVDLLSSVSNEDGEKVKTVPVNHLNCLMPDDVNGLLNGLELALRAQNSSINRLPRYLTIHLERVKFDKKIGQSVKNFSELHYPLEFDAYSLCSDELKRELEANQKATSTNGEDSLSMDIDKTDMSTPKDQLTGFYDLIALIAHAGPSVISGHYISLIKQDEDKWIQFDDGTKTILNNEEVLKLTGGGNGQMAYICLYKARVG